MDTLGSEVRMEAVERRLMSVEEMAIYLHLSPRSIYNGLTKKTKRPFPVKAKRIGKAVRFDKKDVDAYIESL